MPGLSGSASRSIDRAGNVNVSENALPDWRAARSVTAVGTTGWRAVGSPGAAHPAASAPKRTQEAKANGAAARLNSSPLASSSRHALEDVAAEVLIFHDVGKLFGDVGPVHLDVFLFHVRRVKGNFFQHFFEDGVQASRADVFGLLVDHYGVARQGGDGIFGEVELEAFCI